MPRVAGPTSRFSCGFVPAAEFSTASQRAHRSAKVRGTLVHVLSLPQVLRRAGGAAPYRAFEAAGIARSAVGEAVRAGELLRVRNGWFALPDAHPDVIRAVRVGGIATAASVAAMHRLWVPLGGPLHVRVAPTASRLRSPNDRQSSLDTARDAVCVHYTARAAPQAGRDDLPSALAEMFACADDVEALAAVESAIERRVLDPAHLGALRAMLPPSRQKVLERLDLNGQSGLETKMRMFLRSTRVRFRAQVAIESVGLVDFLIGDRLVIEVDGWQFHSGRRAFEEDRRRDFELVTRGYLVLRLSYRQVMHDWERSRRGIRALLERGEHRWRGGRQSPYPPVRIGE